MSPGDAILLEQAVALQRRVLRPGDSVFPDTAITATVARAKTLSFIQFPPRTDRPVVPDRSPVKPPATSEAGPPMRAAASSVVLFRRYLDSGPRSEGTR